MFSAISLLVLACVITINAQTPRCSEAISGIVPTSHAVKVQPVNLAPLKPDWKISIPYIAECVYGVSGVQAFMCDMDVAPTGYFTDLNQLMVHRNGNLQGVGTVTITAFCNV